MKVIKSDPDGEGYQRILRPVISQGSPLVMWQVNLLGQRKIADSFLKSFQPKLSLLHLTSEGVRFIDEQLPVYIYSEHGQFIFKSYVNAIDDKSVSLVAPVEIKLLEGPDVTIVRGQIGLDSNDIWKTKRLAELVDLEPDYLRVKSMSERSGRDQVFLSQKFDSLTVDEEDIYFADKRESPRRRATAEKWVNIKIDVLEQVHRVILFDLSRGGMGFVTSEPQYFLKGRRVRILGFEDFDLDDPLVGRIMSQRPIDDLKLHHKIGVRFDDGQD